MPDDINDSNTLGSVIRAAIRRHVALILVCVLVGGAAGYIASTVLKRTYTASTSILLQPVPGNPLSPTVGTSNNNQLTVAMTTEVSLVTTPVVDAAASKLAGHTLPAVGDNVSATVPASTQIVVVTYAAPTDDRATAGANAYAQAFLNVRAANAKSSVDAQVAALKKQLDTASDSLKKASSEASSNTDPRSYAAQQTQLYAERVASLNNSISTASAMSQDPGAIVRKATSPVSSNGLPAWVFVLAGLFAGLAIGLLAAAARQLSDKRVRSRDDQVVDGLPILASTSVAMRPIVGKDGTADPSLESLSETFRQLRTGVTTAAGRGTVVALTSLTPTRPTSLPAFNLTSSLASSGYRACVIDLDPASGGIDTGDGSVREVDGVEVRSMARGTDIDGVSGPQFRAQLDEMRSSYDFTILAVGPSGTADGDAGASLADATVLVAVDNRTVRPEINAARARVLRLGAPALGILCVGDVPAHRPDGRTVTSRRAQDDLRNAHAVRD